MDGFPSLLALPKGMQKFALAVALSLLPSLDVAAQQFTSPEDLLGTLYDAYLTTGVTSLAPYFSDELTEAMGDARITPAIMEAMGVDPLVGAEGAVITQLKMQSEPGEGERTVVEVAFHNRQTPVQLKFVLVNEAKSGWQIDHLEGKSGEVTWCSRSIVAASGANQLR